MTSRAFLVAAGTAVLSWMLVGTVRAYALRRGMLDHPQARSSHDLPTPRGGGAGLVVAALIGFLILWSPGRAPWDWRLGAALAALVPTVVMGWLDDRASLPVLPRFLAHAASGILIAPLAVGDGVPLVIAIAASAFWIFAAVSAINVVNFIDGIDGLIALQAIVFGMHVAMLAPAATSAHALGIVLAAASGGFLVWNWAPARIFLGDVGSGGIAVFGLVAGSALWRTDTWSFVTVFLPLYAIFLDASVTLARRARSGERLTTPHRRHLYQRLARDCGWGHARVSLLYGVVAASATVVARLTPPARTLAWTAGYVLAVSALGWALDRRVAARLTR